MKLFPRTLLGRTALYLGSILVFSSVAWTAAIGYFVLRPLRHIYDRQIADTILMAQALLEREGAPAGSPTREPPFAQFSGLRVVAENEPRPKFLDPSRRTLPAEILTGLRARLGERIDLEQEAGNEIVWIRFPAGDRFYWLVVPLVPPAVFPYPTLLWVGGGFTLTIAGAYLIVFQLARRLRRITDATGAVGRGQPAAPLEETGPAEIRELSAGFNRMAGDLQREESERRLMLAGISHDLRTPLTRLRIAAELGAPGNDAALAAGMIHDIEEMDAILKQFLDYARSGGEEAPVEADLEEIVREVCGRYRRAGHDVDAVLGGVPPFAFRPLALRRAVANLVENAVRYGRGPIEVRVAARDGRTLLEVADRGPGVAPDRLAEMARPFVRESPARAELGAGLGLAIVERIAQAHGGRLILRNREGGGFLAAIELPRGNS